MKFRFQTGLSLRHPLRFIFCLVLALQVCASRAEPTPLHDGDIVFHTSRSAQSLAVQKATGSKYSHMGIIFMRQGKPFVYEAAGRVEFTPWEKWVARGIGGHVVVRRLKNADEVLRPDALERMRLVAKDYKGRPYDLRFEWSDDRIYCSELVWKIYQRALGIELGQRQKIREFRLQASEVQQKMNERYGKNVPLDEPAISPVALFDSPRLVTVLER